MGIKGLRKFLQENSPNAVRIINSSELKDKIVAIDISIYLYKFVCVIKNTGTDTYSDRGYVTTHIQAILCRLFALMKHRIKPVFIFDGKPPDLKREVLNERMDKKNNALSELDKLRSRLTELRIVLSSPIETIEDVNNCKNLFEEFMDIRLKIKVMLKQSASITSSQMKECKEFLQIIGLPFIEAPTEADSQCAHLCKMDDAFAVSSEDMDILTFGTKKLIINLSAGLQCTVYDLESILIGLNVTMNQFIDICILLGCDYTCTLKGLGPKKILRYIKEYKNIENIIASGEFTVPDDFDYVSARKMFLDPPVTHDYNLEWKIPKYDELTTFLRNKYAYSDNEITKLVSMLRDGYYGTISGEKSTEEYAQIKRKQRASIFEMDDDN